MSRGNGWPRYGDFDNGDGTFTFSHTSNADADGDGSGDSLWAFNGNGWSGDSLKAKYLQLTTGASTGDGLILATLVRIIS